MKVFLKVYSSTQTERLFYDINARIGNIKHSPRLGQCGGDVMLSLSPPRTREVAAISISILQMRRLRLECIRTTSRGAEPYVQEAAVWSPRGDLSFQAL